MNQLKSISDISSKILNVNEIAQPRSPTELQSWVLSKYEEFGLSEEVKKLARLSYGLYKKLNDEIFPLSCYAVKAYPNRDDVKIIPNLNNDNYDAKIEIGCKSNKVTQFIEITYAKNGHDESLRMEVLNNEGSVSRTAPIYRSRSKYSEIIVEEGFVLIPHVEVVNTYLNIVEQSIIKKSKKYYGNSYVLVVAVDDYYPLIRREDVSELDNRVKRCICNLKLYFRELVIVGIAGKIFLSYPINEKQHALRLVC